MHILDGVGCGEVKFVVVWLCETWLVSVKVNKVAGG